MVYSVSIFTDNNNKKRTRVFSSDDVTALLIWGHCRFDDVFLAW